MKNILVAILFCAILLVSSCSWFLRHNAENQNSSVIKTQICPDDLIACR